MNCQVQNDSYSKQMCDGMWRNMTYFDEIVPLQMDKETQNVQNAMRRAGALNPVQADRCRLEDQKTHYGKPI
jgi:hypothetical protein